MNSENKKTVPLNSTTCYAYSERFNIECTLYTVPTYLLSEIGVPLSDILISS